MRVKSEFDYWMDELKVELSQMLSHFDTDSYIDSIGPDCWREMYDAGMSPYEAALEDFTSQVCR